MKTKLKYLIVILVINSCIVITSKNSSNNDIYLLNEDNGILNQNDGSIRFKEITSECLNSIKTQNKYLWIVLWSQGCSTYNNQFEDFFSFNNDSIQTMFILCDTAFQIHKQLLHVSKYNKQPYVLDDLEYGYFRRNTKKFHKQLDINKEFKYKDGLPQIYLLNQKGEIIYYPSQMITSKNILKEIKQLK